MSYSSEVLADSPWAFWEQTETSGTSLADATGNLRALIISGSPTLAQTGPDGATGNAVAWGDSSVSAQSGATFGAFTSTLLTFEAWVYLTAVPTNRTGIMSTYSGSSGQTSGSASSGLSVETNGKLRWWLYNGAVKTVTSPAALTLNEWHHVVASVGAAGMKIRVDKTTVVTDATVVSRASGNERLHVHGGRAADPGPYHLSSAVRIAVPAVYTSQVSDARTDAHFDAVTVVGPPTTVSLGVASESSAAHAVAASVGTVRSLGSATESTTVHAVAASAGQSVALGVAVETTTVTPMLVVEGQLRNLPAATEATAVHAVAPLVGFTVGLGVVTESTTVSVAAPVEGEVTPLGAVVEVTTVHRMSVTLGYGVTNPDSPVSGRHRGGVGYASWLPSVVPTPPHLGGVGGGPGGAPAAAAVDVALAFSDVTIVGTQPTFTTTQASQPRHRDRIIVGGRDVTYFRGAEVRVGNYQLMEPFGYGTATLEFPQVYPEYEAIGEGDLSWLAPQSRVLIQRVDSAGNIVATDYKGYLIAPNANTGTFTYEVGGEVTGPAALRWRPMPLFRTVEDIGRQMARVLGFVGVRTPRLGPDTGIEIARVGGMTLLEYMQQLVGRAWTRDGNQWTVMPDANGVYKTERKDRTTVHGTVYLSASSAEADLRRDISEEPNRIFATGVTPAGKRVRFGRYPGLDISGNPPAFPGNLSAGDTGDGVLALIRQLQVQGYLNAETAPGQYDSDVTKAIREVQEDADLTVTGNVNSATWDAIFDNTSQGVSLKLARIEPAAQKRYTKQYRYSASGAIKGRNPFYDPTRLKIDRSIDFGTGFTQAQMREWSKTELVDGAEPNWVGTLTIHSGAIVAGDHTPGDPITAILPARDIKPGMNLSLPQFQGGVIVHVTAAQTAGDVVTLQVDTRARDAWNVAQVIERNRESRRDPARAFFRELASSKNQKDAIEEWSEVGGLIPDQDLVQGWNVFEVIAGQAGTVRSIRYETNPNAESSVAVFGKRVWPKALQRLVGNPLSAEGAERWANENIRRQLERDHGLLYAAGDDTDPGGYSPGYKSGTSSIFTGRFEDDASFAYYTDHRPILFVAVYVDRDCTIPGGRIMWPQLESGA